MNGTVAVSISGLNASAATTTTETGSAVVDLDIDLLAETADQEVDFTLDVSLAKIIYIVSDVAVTLKANSSSAATDTLALAAGVPVVWCDSWLSACPFTQDVTKLFFTVAGAVAANVQIKCLYDAVEA